MPPFAPAILKRIKPDPFVSCPRVAELEETVFNTFLSEQNVSLVMFYDPTCPECQRSKPHFVKAARTTDKEAGSFAAVNCNKNPDLCRQEGAFRRKLPVFKLYARGQHVSDHENVLDYHSFKDVVENTPFFPRPKPKHSGFPIIEH